MKENERFNIDQLYKLMKRANEEEDADSAHALLWAIYQLEKKIKT